MFAFEKLAPEIVVQFRPPSSRLAEEKFELLRSVMTTVVPEIKVISAGQLPAKLAVGKTALLKSFPVNKLLGKVDTPPFVKLQPTQTYRSKGLLPPPAGPC